MIRDLPPRRPGPNERTRLPLATTGLRLGRAAIVVSGQVAGILAMPDGVTLGEVLHRARARQAAAEAQDQRT